MTGMKLIFGAAVVALAVGCGKSEAPEPPQPEPGGGFSTSPGAGPVAPVDPHQALPNYGGSATGAKAKEKAKDVGARMGQGSVGSGGVEGE
jgi:hypothetical protein